MSAEIVSLSARRRLMAHPALVQIEAYWDALRAGRQMPSRAEIDPRGLEGTLPHCFVLERIAPGMARFRVAGRMLATALGIEMQGMPISIAFDGPSRDVLEDALERVFATPQILRLTVSARLGIGRGRIEGQMLFLPLRDDLGGVTRILGALAVTDGDVAARSHPRRLTIDAAHPRDIPEGGPMRASPVLPQRAAAPVPGPGEVIPLQPV